MFPRSARRAFPRKIPHSHLQLLHRASILSPSSKGAADFPTNEFSLKLITPDSKEPLVHDFHDAWGLDALVKSYHGSLRGPIPNRQRIISYSDYSTLSLGNTYEISSPYFKAIQEQRLHNQIADKAFESKARYALIKYFGAKGIEYREMERVIMSGLDAVGEWEGIFEVGDEVWVLECKNIVNEITWTKKKKRMNKWMAALGKSGSNGKIFLAGKFWGEDSMDDALEAGYGVLGGF